MRSVRPFARRACAIVACLAALSGCTRRRSPSPPRERSAEPAATPSAPPPVSAPAAFDAEALRRRARVPALAYGRFPARPSSDGGDREVAGAVGFRVGTSPIARSSPFLVASIAKLFVATAVMQLVESGRLDLDADVSTYLDFSVRAPIRGAERVTLHGLLNHTARVHDDFAKLAPRPGDPRPALGPFLRGYFSTPDAFEPPLAADGGDGRVHYSNVGFALAAYVVERVAREPFAELTRRTIFAPLGMTSTRWVTPGDPTAAIPHACPPAGCKPVERDPYPVYPAVDLWSTVDDLGRYGRALIDGGILDGARILRTETVAALLDTSSIAASRGFMTRSFGDGELTGHEGEDRGASTGFYIDRREGREAAIVVLANGDAFASGDPERILPIGELVTALSSRR